MNRLTSASIALTLALGLGCSGGGITTASDPGALTRAENPGLCAPPTAFSYALCTCESLTQVGLLNVGTGPSGEGSVGVNGTSTVANASQISGSWVSWMQMTAATGTHVGGSLRSGGDLQVVGDLSIGGDLSVKQNLTGAGILDVGGAVRVGGSDQFVGLVQGSGKRAAFDAPTVPPCGCADETLFDVAGAVAQASSKNDNAAFGISSNMLNVGVQNVTLDTGRYYFQNVSNIGAGVLDIRGNVSIYIDGSLDEIGAQAIKIDDGASLDLYVSGAVRLVGFTPIGDRQAPSSFRLYVGGSDGLVVGAGLQEFFGSIYAPKAEIALAGLTTVWGSLFAKDVVEAGILTINHGGAIPPCTPPVTETLPPEGNETPGTTPPPPPPTMPMPSKPAPPMVQ